MLASIIFLTLAGSNIQNIPFKCEVGHLVPTKAKYEVAGKMAQQELRSKMVNTVEFYSIRCDSSGFGDRNVVGRSGELLKKT